MKIESHKDWNQKAADQITASEKFGLAVSNGIGNMRFIVIGTVIIIIWITLNVLFRLWDKYPFILLNLMFSAFAFYASPLILMAQNLQAKRDKIQAEHQYKHQEQELELNTTLTKEIHEFTKAINESITKDKA